MTYHSIDEDRQKIIDSLLQKLAGEGELISDVLVVTKVMTDDGQLTVRVIQSTGTDWLTRRVLLDVAYSAELDFS